MKLRAKIILTAASLALSCALLAGCGSSSGSTALLPRPLSLPPLC